MKLVTVKSWTQWASVWEPAREPVIIQSIALGKLVLADNKLPRELWKRTCLPGGDCLSQQQNSRRWSQEENGGRRKWMWARAWALNEQPCLWGPHTNWALWVRVSIGTHWLWIPCVERWRLHWWTETEVRREMWATSSWEALLGFGAPSKCSVLPYVCLCARRSPMPALGFLDSSSSSRLEFLQPIPASPLTTARGFGDLRRHKVF